MSFLKSIGNVWRGARAMGEISIEMQKSGEDFQWDSFFQGINQDETADTFNTPGTRDQLQVYKKSALVYACVSRLASAFQEAPLQVEVKDKDGKWQPAPKSNLTKPFTENLWLDESQLMQYIVMHLELTGRSFLWLWRDGTGAVREIWPIPPSWVEIKLIEQLDPNKEKRVVAFFKVTPPGHEAFPIDSNDMIYLRFPDPSNLWGSVSPVVAASPFLQIEDKALEFKGDSLDNLKLPGPVIKTSKSLTREQKNDLRSVMRRKLGGKSFDDSAILISGAEASFELLNPAKDFDWDSFSDLDETRICMVFGVPPIVIGAWVGLKNSPWSNTGEAKRWMYSNTVNGLWKMVGSALTNTLIPKKNLGKVRISFDLTNVLELQEDIFKVSERARQEYNDGLITRGEGRGMIKREEQDGDDVYKVGAMDSFIRPGEEIDAGMAELSDEENLTPAGATSAGTTAVNDDNEDAFDDIDPGGGDS